jgi:hypothetical protein
MPAALPRMPGNGRLKTWLPEYWKTLLPLLVNFWQLYNEKLRHYPCG